MATKKKSTKQSTNEPTSLYFLKILGYFVLGAIWVHVQHRGQEFAVPIGLPIGLLLNRHEKLQIDQKIEIAVLVVATFLSFFLPLGVILAV